MHPIDYGYYRGGSYFNPNELLVTRLFEKVEKVIRSQFEKIKKFFTGNSNSGGIIFKGVLVGSLLFLWRLLYVWWRFGNGSNNRSYFFNNQNGFVDGNMVQSFVDNEPVEQHMQRRKEWERLRRDPYGQSTTDQSYMSSPQYYLQNPYFPLNTQANRERNFFTYFPSYRSRIEDLEFKEESLEGRDSTSNQQQDNTLGRTTQMPYYFSDRRRRLVGLRRRNLDQVNTSRQNFLPVTSTPYSSQFDGGGGYTDNSIFGGYGGETSAYDTDNYGTSLYSSMLA